MIVLAFSLSAQATAERAPGWRTHINKQTHTIYMYVYVYIYIYIYTPVYIYIYIYITYVNLIIRIYIC